MVTLAAANEMNNVGSKTMASLMVQHKVRDYAAWRPGYDAHEPSRVGAGITNGRVYRKAEDPNDLVLIRCRGRRKSAGVDSG